MTGKCIHDRNREVGGAKPECCGGCFLDFVISTMAFYPRCGSTTHPALQIRKMTKTVTGVDSPLTVHRKSNIELLLMPHKKREKQKETPKTYNSRCSLMVTHSTTNLPVSGLSMGEQTGP
ncbi:hypothetical protein CI102_15181, partial [Trichoderma harzianum]